MSLIQNRSKMFSKYTTKKPLLPIDINSHDDVFLYFRTIAEKQKPSELRLQEGAENIAQNTKEQNAPNLIKR